MSFGDERADLFDQTRDFRGVVGLTLDEQIVALRSDADVQEAFEVAEIVVVGPEERGEPVLTDGNAASGSGSDRDISLCYKELTDQTRYTPGRAGQASRGEPLGLILMCSSRSCRGSTVDGASHMRSTACVVFGNGMTSRIEVSPASSAQMRSRPSARPPCGGVPYSSDSRKKPKRCFASSSLEAEQAEHRGLRRRDRGYECAAAQLPAVEDDVVGLGQHAARIGLEQVQIFFARRGERVIHRVPSLLVGVPVEQREVGDPEQFPLAFRHQVLLPGHLQPSWPSTFDTASGAPEASTSRSSGVGAGSRQHARVPSSPIALTDDCTPSAVKRAHTRPAAPSLLRLLDELIDFAARVPAAPGITKPRTVPPWRPPRGRCRTAIREQRAEVLNLEPEAQVRLVGAVLAIASAYGMRRNGRGISTPISRSTRPARLRRSRRPAAASQTTSRGPPA